MSKVKEDTAKVDNTAVVKPKVFERLRVTPRKYELVDLGGTPSNDTRTPAERNKDYLHPIKGAKERFKASMSNETNPLVGIERTILPSAAGAALVTTPATVVGGALGNAAVDKFTGGWGEWLENKTGIPSEIGVYTNPGAWYGGVKGHKAGKLSKKFVLGDEDLGWSPLINSKYFKRYSKIPIEEGGYYRVTSNNEIAAINKSGKLQVPDRSYYDTQTARLIADRLKMTPEEVLALDNKNPKLLDEMFNAAPKPKGTLGLRPRRKSNHGDVAFQKEGLFYDSNNPKSPYYGSPTIKGSQSKSRFQEGHHGKYTDNFNEDININEAPHYGASVLREGNEASNFTYFDRGLFGWREKTFDNNNGLINKNHWIFNREARTPTNIAMATANRITPFLSKVEKLPLKVVAYNAAKRTNGNASVSMQDIKNMPAEYTGSAILGGGNLEGRNLLVKYIFDENPIVKRAFFSKDIKNIKPISKNESKRSFSHGDRYEQLYPGIYNRRYEMRSVVPQGRPLKFSSSEFAEYAGNNPVGKVIGKEGDMIMRTGDTEFMVFRNPGTNYVGPIDDVGGHVIKLQMDKGKLKQTSQDMWKFNPADYAKRWNESPNAPDQVRLTKQAALMDKVGTPFILQQSNPIWIEGRSVRQAMKVGGKFTFKKSPAVKDAEKLNGKRDMRKKFVKSSRPTYKRRIRKGQVGMRFVSYVPVSNPIIDYTDITNPINPFSEYYIPTTYNTEQALVVPEREDSKSDTVEETPVVASKPIAEPVVNKPVASKVVVDTANSTWSSPYKDRSKWAADLTNAYKRAGITNDNAIRMLVSQDALESAWGRSAQGKFNFGNLTTGAKWKGDYVNGNDKNAKGEAIKQKFRSYNSMDEYAADKVQFLKRLYDFDENDDINKFVAKLTGSNKGKRRYAEARNYASLLKGVYNKYAGGGIIKYQEPAQPIKYLGGYDKRGNMVLPVTNENGINNVTLPEVTVTPRNINLAGAVDRGRREAAPYISTLLAGTMFGPLPVLSEAIGSTTVDEATRELSKGKYNTWGDMMTNAGMNPVLAEFTNPGSYIGLHGFNKFGPKLKPVEDLAASGNKWARARVISKTIDKGTPSVEPLPNNVGWGPRQSIHVVHDKNSARFPKLYYPERWDAVYEGAPEAGIWYQGKFGNPRTAANHSIPGKAEKAAKARERDLPRDLTE